MSAWDAEFRGYFWGEGCLDVAYFTRRKGKPPSFTPRARIGVASCDRGFLVEIQERFGGSITTRPTDGSVTWQLTGREPLAHLVEVLNRGVTASCKRAQLTPFREAVDLIQPKGRNYTPAIRGRFMELKNELEALKRVR